MPLFPFEPDHALTAISIAYRNRRLIADEAMPRVPVGRMEFKYLEYDLRQAFTVPDTKVGRKSIPNEIVLDATEKTSATEDYALDDVVPVVDIQNAPRNHSPIDQATATLTDLILLDREIRVAGVIFAAATYPAGNKVQLAGTDQWNDYANSTPIDDIAAGIDTPIIRPNTMVIGRQAFTKLAQHPDVVKAVHGNQGDKGFARREAIAELFELDKVLVGEGFHNIAKPGQAANLQRVWGRHCSLLWLDPNFRSPTGGATFGFTAQYQSRISGQMHEPKVGMRGSTRVRVGESVREVVSASALGYFIEDAVG
jgi:hypothetical protein